MSRDFKLLVSLQEIDIKILEIENSKKEFPKNVAELEKKISDATNNLENTQKKIDELQKEHSKITTQLHDSQQLMERSQERLNAIKTNKEYDAVHAEIESQKILVANSNKRMQKLEQDIATLQNTLNENLNYLDKAKTENEPIIIELKSKIATIDSSIQSEVEKRQATASHIALNLLRAYEHIKPSRKNGKVCGIITNNTKNCTICYQNLTPQVVNQVRKSPDPVYCQSCGSILIWNENLNTPE